MALGSCVDAAASQEPAPDYEAIEQFALASTLVDLVQVIATLAPGALDRTLSIARLRLQQLETGRDAPALANEDVVLRFKINMLERGLGRDPTVG